MVKSVVEIEALVPEENSGMEDLLKQLEAEGWTGIKKEKKTSESGKKRVSLIDETNRLLREYDISISGRVGTESDSVSYKRIEQKAKEFSRLQSKLDRRLYLEDTSVMKGAESLLNGLERIAKKPVITITPTEEFFGRYFQTGEELNQLLEQAYAHYQERMESVESFKDGRVLKLFVQSMNKKKRIESKMGKTNNTFAMTGEQLSNITKDSKNFPLLYIAYNNLRREVKGLANELEKTCQRIVIKNQEMYIISDYEERLGNAVAVFDRERAYLIDILEHAKETFSIYTFGKELSTGVVAVHDAARSLSKMTYAFVGRVLQSSNEIARMETQMSNERMLPKILDGLSKEYGISLTGTKSVMPSFVNAAEAIAGSAGIA